MDLKHISETITSDELNQLIDHKLVSDAVESMEECKFVITKSVDVCPCCNGSFLQTGGFPIGVIPDSEEWCCQKCYQREYYLRN